MKMKKFLLIALAGALAAWLATHTGASDWRYPKLLLSQAPKMPFRYFV